MMAACNEQSKIALRVSRRLSISRCFLLLPALLVGLLWVPFCPLPVEAEGSGRRLPVNLIRVPLVRQSTDYTCGVAALQSLLGYFAIEEREDKLAAELRSDRKQGTAFARIVKAAEKRGLSAQVQVGMTIPELKGYIDSRKPVLCLVQAWAESKNGQSVNYERRWQDGHYVVAVGYDDDCFYFMDPSTLGHFAYIPRAEFEKRWHDTDGSRKLEHFGMVFSNVKNVPKYEPEIAKPME